MPSSWAAMSVKVLMLGLRVAAAWTLLSLVIVGFWVLALEVARRIGSKAVSKPPGWERYN
jgi:hypothetical protein